MHRYARFSLSFVALAASVTMACVVPEDEGAYEDELALEDEDLDIEAELEAEESEPAEAASADADRDITSSSDPAKGVCRGYYNLTRNCMAYYNLKYVADGFCRNYNIGIWASPISYGGYCGYQKYTTIYFTCCT